MIPAIGDSGGDLNGARIEAVTPRKNIDTQNQVPAETFLPPPLRAAAATAPDTSATIPAATWIEVTPLIGVLASCLLQEPRRSPEIPGETRAARPAGNQARRRSLLAWRSGSPSPCRS